MIEPRFLVGDATRLQLADASVDLIVTHPPYIGVDTKRYGGEAKAQINHESKKFMKLLVKATREMERVLKDSGSLWVCVGGSDTVGFEYVTKVLKHTSLQFSGWVHWDYSTGPNPERLSQDHNAWFHFTKTDRPYYNPFMVKRQHTNNWVVPVNNAGNIVDLGLESEGHFTADAVPEQIPARLIEMFSKAGGVVLDPFGGTGVTAVQAWKAGRQGISIDISPEQQKIALKRYEYSA
jgi:DNA modification methylase